jgi:citrate synthase
MSSVEEIMTAPAVTASPAEDLAVAVARMRDHRVGSVVVVKDGRPVGIVTERDVIEHAATTTDLGATAVEAVMSSPVDVTDASVDPSVALTTMRERGYRHMPVTRDGVLVGVVSLRDLARLATIGPADVPRGLKGVVVADTTVGDVRGNEGFFHYRQFSAVDLARTRPLEDVWQLLVDGALPATVEQRDAFAAEVGPLRALAPAVEAALPSVVAAAPAPMDALRTALSLACAERGLRPIHDLDRAGRRADALFVAAVTPTLVAAVHRLAHGQAPVAPRPDLPAAADYLRMLTGSEPSEAHRRAVERYLVTTIDHGFNASTFTARVVASTRADVGACAVAALGALSGPLHGGAPSRALDLLDEIRSPARARSVITEKVRRGERIMGFGHAVYRTEDPRSRLLREVAIELGGELAELAVAVEQTVVDVLAELKPGRDLYANVEFYAGVVMATCGIPPELFTPTFATSRMIGWTANVLEQADDPKIIRPSARYVGAPPPQPVPVL